MMLLIEAIRDRRLGAVEHVAVSYSLPMPGLKKGLAGHWMFGETGRIMLEVGPHPVSVVCRLVGAVKQATTAVAGEITLPDHTRLFGTWMSSMVCERGTGTVMLSTGMGFGSASVHVIGEDGEAFVDLLRNTLRISEKNRYIRAADLVDGMRNGLSVARQSLSNFRAFAMGSTGLGKPYLLQDMAVRNSLESFYNAVRSGHAPVIGAEQGTNVVEACHMIIDGARRFAEEREPVAVG
jgi:predicted dehydrogenase